MDTITAAFSYYTKLEKEVPRLKCPKCHSTARYIDGEVLRQTRGQLFRIGCIICGCDEFWNDDYKPYKVYL